MGFEIDNPSFDLPGHLKISLFSLFPGPRTLSPEPSPFLFDFPDGLGDVGGALDDLLSAAVEDHGGGRRSDIVLVR